MADKVYQAGNTVRIKATFKDFGGENKDPDLVKVIIYDQRYNVIIEQVISASNRSAVGDYFYDFETPFEVKPSKYYYEWYGEILGSPSLKRDSFKTVFA